MSKYTKQLIQSKCLELLEAKPLDKVTVTEIITECEMNRNTFYYYYKDIFDVIEEIFMMEVDRVKQKQDIDVSFYEAYMDAIKLFIKYKRAVFHVFQSKNEGVFNRYLNEIVYSFVEQYVNKHTANRGVSEFDKQYIEDFYACYIINRTKKWIRDGMGEDYLDFSIRISDTFESTIESMVYLCEKKQYSKK